MSRSKANIILFVLFIMIAIAGYMYLSIKSDYHDKRQKYIEFEKSAKDIYLIKRLKKSMPIVLSSLSSIKKPMIKDRGVTKIYIFENLNLNDLNRLLKKIQGAYLPIKKLEIKRDMTNHASVTLEVAK